MKPVFSQPEIQKLYEEGHPFFVNWAETFTKPRKELEIELAYQLTQGEAERQQHLKTLNTYEWAVKKLEALGVNMSEARSELEGMKASYAERANKRHKVTNIIKAEIKKEWDLWQDGKLRFANTNKFAEHVMGKYSFPKSASSIRKWNKEWRKER